MSPSLIMTPDGHQGLSSEAITDQSPQEKTNYQPLGMIPEFNAWGHHPDNLLEYIHTHARAAYERLGISGKYPEAERLMATALNDIANQPPEFTGHHIPTETSRRLLQHYMETFINVDACTFIGKENYKHALELVAQGNNLVIAPNHSSPLDALVPFALFTRHFPGESLPAVIMSQVFEYARITGLLTSGVEKYPVFQPKHIIKFSESQSAVAEMGRQNQITLRALCNEAKQGSKKVFLYFERDRNSEAMGVPEPVVIRILQLMSRVSHDLYVLPMHVSGLETIFPNRKGINELDVFFETLSRGQGRVNCGQPIPFSRIVEKVSAIDQDQLVSDTLGKQPDNERDLQLAATALLTLGLVANLAPTEESRGVYRNHSLMEMVRELI